MTRSLPFATALLALSTALAAQSIPRPGGRVGSRPRTTRPTASLELLDFAGFPAGTVLTEVFSTSGFGPVVMRGYNPFLGLGANAALVFDTAFPTGGDFDLGSPHRNFGGPGIGAGGASGPFRNDQPRGRVAIIAENLNDGNGDGLIDSPDDLNAAATTDATLSFDFTAVGTVSVHGLTIMDVEAAEQPPTISYFGPDGSLIGVATLPATGDNGVAQVDLGGVRGVRRMLVHMRGSGAVDDLLLEGEPAPSIVLLPDLAPVDLTPDGRTALLFDQFSADGDVHFYDVETGALVPKTTVGSPLRSFPTGISATERVSALYGDPNLAALWTEAGGWLDLGNVFPMGCLIDPETGAQDQGGAWDVTADGTAAVGLLWNECNAVAFRWSEGGGLAALELLGESFPGSTSPPSNRATKISDDGSLIGGFAQTALVDRWPALWTPAGSGFLLPAGEFTPDSPGEVLSVNADGSMVAGIWNLEGFYWTESEGVVRLGLLPGGLPGGQTFPNAIAAGDQLVFGKISPGFFDPPVAFVWTRAHGMRSLRDVAVAAGLVMPPGITLDNVLAASADGSVLLGSAFDDFFRFYAFVLRLPTSAYGL